MAAKLPASRMENEQKVTIETSSSGLLAVAAVEELGQGDQVHAVERRG
ncbi:MAG: hypothetical protein R2724_14470 [Bryobacterales bacterium]